MSICIKFQGGLGNQLFQYAFGKAVEKYTGIDVIFDTSYFKISGPERQYELCNFNVDAKLSCLEPQKDILKKIFRELLIFKTLKRKINVYKKLPVYRKLNVCNSFEFDPSFKNINDNEYIEGFFQNERYFKDISDIIRNDFKLVVPLDELNEKILADIRNTESICIHIRRGDYLDPERMRDYGMCTREYYQEAISIIKNNAKNKNFKAFIFTDDPIWVKDNIHFDIDTYYVDNNIGKGYFDLELMKNCKHNIIANSSFSWWGAWLNENPDKIVIAPNPWFLCEKSDFELIPESWIRLEGLSSELVKNEDTYKKSYAQCGEDLIVENLMCLIFDKKEFNYLDIGANHSAILSNTKRFYDMGCRGVLVEPDPTLYEEIKENRSEDIVLNCGISDNDDLSADFYVMNPSVLNTFDKDEALHCVNQGYSIYRVIKVPLKNINDILNTYFADGLDFLSLDAEGYDLRILKSLNFNKYRPKIICAETLEFTKEKNKQKITEITDFLTQNEYKVYADTYINTIYVDVKNN